MIKTTGVYAGKSKDLTPLVVCSYNHIIKCRALSPAPQWVRLSEWLVISAQAGVAHHSVFLPAIVQRNYYAVREDREYFSIKLNGNYRS